MLQQIPLPLKPLEDFNFNSFIADENLLLVDSLKANTEPFIFLWGEKGSGKTKLLQASCQFQTEQGKTAAYLPLQELQRFSPEILHGMENIDLVCIDDIELVLGQTNWEEGLFNLFNQLRQAKGRLVVSAPISPQHSSAKLNDLKSRLTSGLSLKLVPLTDESTLKAIQLHAKQQGLDLNTDCAKYLLTHFPRDLPSLLRLLDTLGQANLVEQRKISIPFIKRVIRDSPLT